MRDKFATSQPLAEDAPLDSFLLPEIENMVMDARATNVIADTENITTRLRSLSTTPPSISLSSQNASTSRVEWSDEQIFASNLSTQRSYSEPYVNGVGESFQSYKRAQDETLLMPPFNSDFDSRSVDSGSHSRPRMFEWPPSAPPLPKVSNQMEFVSVDQPLIPPPKYSMRAGTLPDPSSDRHSASSAFSNLDLDQSSSGSFLDQTPTSQMICSSHLSPASNLFDGKQKSAGFSLLSIISFICQRMFYRFWPIRT